MGFKVDVVDLSVHNTVADFAKVRSSGVRGIIHKATEGTNFVDRKYAERRKMAKDAGLLWGAYHFANSQPVAAQVDHFLNIAQPDGETLLALDWEECRFGTMSLDQAKEFLRLVYERTGQMPVLYSGNVLKERLRGKPDAFISKHRLWLAQYSSKASLPPGFSKFFLWQFSGDGYGGYGNIPGIPTKGIDCNMFGGSDIAAEWAPSAKLPPAASAFVIPAADGPAGYEPETHPEAHAALKEESAIYSILARILRWFGLPATILGGAATAGSEVPEAGINVFTMLLGFIKEHGLKVAGLVVAAIVVIEVYQYLQRRKVLS